MSWPNAFNYLQDALAVASAGDQIWVARGIYWPDLGGGQTPLDRNATFQLLTGVDVYGGFRGNENALEDRQGLFDSTILSGDLLGDDGLDFLNNDENSYHIVTITSFVLLDGFTIRGGNAGAQNGGGIHIENARFPIISRCTFHSNMATSGGGLYNSASAPTNGGTFEVSSPNLINCAFFGNSSNTGGGMSNSAYAANIAGAHTARAEPTLINCVFSGNTATWGGAIWNKALTSHVGGGSPLAIAAPVIINSTFGTNSATNSGGGLYATRQESGNLGTAASHVFLDNAILWNNSDSGGTNQSAQIHRDNSSVATVNYSCVQGGWFGTGNLDSDPEFARPLGRDALLGTTDDDLRLTIGSICIDAGDNDAVPADFSDLDLDGDTTEPTPVDLDEEARFVDMLNTDQGNGTPPIVDMGAYEFQDCNRNGTPDSDDITAGTSSDCNTNGTPDECEIDVSSPAPGGPFYCIVNCDADCNDNGNPDECDADADGDSVPDECDVCPGFDDTIDADGDGVPDGCDVCPGFDDTVDTDGDGLADGCDNCPNHSNPGQEDCDTDGTGDVCTIADCTGQPACSDCNGNGIPDSCDISSLFSDDCNSNGIPDECDPQEDCNSNGSLDICDIGSGFSEDCNDDLVPDECEIDQSSPAPGGPFFCDPAIETCDPDCNNNGIPDECDIVSGTSVDCNLNGIPDECEGALLVVNGYALGSAQQDLTTGGGQVVFSGTGFIDGMEVVFKTSLFSVTVPPVDVDANTGGTELTVVVPPFPPGCDCQDEFGVPLSFIANVTFDNGCETADLASAGESFQYDIAITLINDQFGVQSAIDNAARGTCIVLTSGINYLDPLLIGSAKSSITLTSDNSGSPGATQIFGDGNVGGPPPAVATLRLDAHGQGVCISHLNFVLGNSGVEVKNGAAPIIKHCNIDDNWAGANHGGGITVSTGANPIIWDCLIHGNETTDSGGGIRVAGASATIYDNQILENSATLLGGGVYLEETGSDLSVADNTIWVNDNEFRPVRGGGVCWTGGTVIEPSLGVLVRNDIWGNSADAEGAGVFIDEFVSPIIVNNLIRENSGASGASRGGGIYVEVENFYLPTICGNFVFGNLAQYGGGMALMNKTEAIVDRNIIFCNQAVPFAPIPFYAAGLYVVDAAPAAFHNTILSNMGGSLPDHSGGIHLESGTTGAPMYYDSIVGKNGNWEVFSDEIITELILDYNLFYDPLDPIDLIHGNIQKLGPNNQVGPPDPVFVAEPGTCVLPGDPSDFDALFAAFALQAGSRGENAASDGCNMGAVLSNASAPADCLEAVDNYDCNANGIRDYVDILVTNSADVNMNGIPDECDCPADFDRDGVIGASDMAFLLGNWGDCSDCASCPADLDGDGKVDSFDLAIVLGTWGPCP
ncbi:MAG: hypothetical protein O7D91_15070 [Planctomycetota bacterium]|nr:hypothetical protein [Planctomycetota bacterium]